MIKCIVLNTISQSKRRKAQIRKKYQLWEHKKGGQIKNVRTQQCLTTSGLNSEESIEIAECDDNDLHQIWWFQKYVDVNVKVLPE